MSFDKWARAVWNDPKTQKRHWLIPKDQLQVGHYYLGHCRNARIARWDGEKFWHWRTKFDDVFTETINHPEDDDGFDLFIPDQWLCDEGGDITIPLEQS